MNTARHQLTVKIRRLLVAFTMFAAAIAASLATASTASAATNYGIDMTQACKYTYNGPQYYADFYSPADPFSWVCRYNAWTVGLPAGVSSTNTPIGGVDVQKYCTIAHPGSRAVIIYWNAFGWACRK